MVRARRLLVALVVFAPAAPATDDAYGDPARPKAKATAAPQVQFLGTPAVTTLSVRNAGKNPIAVVEITPPRARGSVSACPKAPRPLKRKRSENRCRYTGGLAGGKRGAFQVTATPAAAA